MAQRGATVGCWIAWDAYPAISWAAAGDRWLWLQLEGATATFQLSFRWRFDSVSSAGTTIIDYTWFLDVLWDDGTGITTLVSLPNPWRTFLGRNENTIIYSQFPGHRLALTIGLSSEPSDGVFTSDGFVTAYIDDAPVAALTGLLLRGKPRATVQPGAVIYYVHEILDRPWIELSPAAPATTSDGALVSTPTDLLIWDDFTGGSLANWPATIYTPGPAPYSVVAIGAVGTYGLSYTANATPSGSWIGSGPFVYRAIARLFDVPAETITNPPPTPGPVACAAPVFGGPSSGAVACPAPVLP